MKQALIQQGLLGGQAGAVQDEIGQRLASHLSGTSSTNPCLTSPAMSKSAMRLVLDTDVVVAALRSPSGASSGLLSAALEGKVQLLANVALVLEYEAVCARTEHLEAAGLNAADLAIFLDTAVSLMVPVESHFVWRPQLRDPADEMVLEAAVNGQADAIVSFNHRDFAAAPSKFGVAVLLPRDAFRRLHP